MPQPAACPLVLENPNYHYIRARLTFTCHVKTQGIIMCNLQKTVWYQCAYKIWTHLPMSGYSTSVAVAQ